MIKLFCWITGAGLAISWTTALLCGQDIDGQAGVILTSTSIDQTTGMYLPVQPQWVDSSGGPTSPPRVQNIGQSGWLLSGRVSLVAPAQSVQALSAALQRRLGKTYALRERTDASFGLRCLVDKDVIWERDFSAGKPTGVPVQGVIPKRPQLPATLTVLVTWTWKEPVLGLSGRCEIDWAAVMALLQASAKEGRLTERDLIKATTAVLKEHAIRVPNGNAAEWDKVVRMLLVTFAVTPVLPSLDSATASAASASPAPQYRLRATPSFDGLPAEIDFSKAIRLEHSATTIQHLPLSSP